MFTSIIIQCTEERNHSGIDKHMKKYKPLWNKIDLILFIIAMLGIDVSLRWRIGLELIKPAAILFDMSFIFVLCGILVLLRKKARLVIESGLLILFSIYAFAQRLHYAYFSLFFSFQKLMLINELNGVMDSVYGKIARRDIIFIFPILFFLFVMFLVKKKIAESENIIGLRLGKRGLIGVLCILLGIAINAYQKNSFPETDNWNLNDKYNYENLANKNRAVDEFGLFTYSYLDTKRVITVHFFKDNSQIIEKINESIGEVMPNHSENEFTGIFKDKNLILIQAESLSNYALNDEIMPTLSKLAKEGISFTNHYAPIYQSATADTEFIAQTSLIPSIDFGSTAYTFQQNQFPNTLANQFRNQGYSANSFHSYYRVFYNREIFHEALGFESFNDKDSLGFVFPEDYLEGVNWPSDVELMDRTMIWTNQKISSKFYNFIITTTGHMPYVFYRHEYEGYYAETLEEYGYSEELTAYIATQKLFDYSLKILMSKLEEQNLLEDTVIVVYGDHYPYGLSESVINDHFGQDYEKYKVPWVIWSMDQKVTGEYDDVVSTFDIMPTLSNLFGLDCGEKTYYTGTDYFSGNQSIIYFMDRSWLTNDYYYDSSKDELRVLNENLSENNASELMKKISRIYEISQDILNGNYFGG